MFKIYGLNPKAKTLKVTDQSDYWIEVSFEESELEIVNSWHNTWYSTPKEWSLNALQFAKSNIEAVLNQVNKLEEMQKVYVRFGKPPISGYSINYITNEREPGVSCFTAFKKGRKITLDLSGVDKVSALFLIDRTPYLVQGEVVGVGSNGEPCLNVGKCRKIPSNYEIEIL